MYVPTLLMNCIILGYNSRQGFQLEFAVCFEGFEVCLTQSYIVITNTSPLHFTSNFNKKLLDIIS